MQNLPIFAYNIAAFVDWKTHQVKNNSETSSYRGWRAANLRVMLTARRITNTVKLSNPVNRSFVISASAAF
jgi:hypothetical protein